MKIMVAKNYDDISIKAAAIIAEEVKKKPNIVLGLATGSSPIGTYRELIRKYKEEKLNFSSVTTFNLDEYYGLSSNHEQSYAHFMRENLFKHININMDNVHIPDGMAEDIEKECRKYDALIEQSNGIELQLLGIGENGHIGFNEPNEELQIHTHLVTLTEATVKANSRFFESEAEVPRQAITVGLGSIMKAKNILLLAYGKNKAEAIAKTIKGRINTDVPSSILQVHPSVTIIIDEETEDYLKKYNARNKDSNKDLAC